MAAETYCPEHREAHRLAYHTRKVELQAERAERERWAAHERREADQAEERETLMHLRYPLPPGQPGSPTYPITHEWAVYLRAQVA